MLDIWETISSRAGLEPSSTQTTVVPATDFERSVLFKYTCDKLFSHGRYLLARLVQGEKNGKECFWNEAFCLDIISRILIHRDEVTPPLESTDEFQQFSNEALSSRLCRIDFTQVKVGRVVGSGASGIVTEVEFQERKYAKKRIEISKKTQLELAIHIHCRHENLLELLYYSTDQGQALFFVPLMDSDGFYVIHKTNVLTDPKQVLKFLLQIAQGMEV